MKPVVKPTKEGQYYLMINHSDNRYYFKFKGCKDNGDFVVDLYCLITPDHGHSFNHGTLVWTKSIISLQFFECTEEEMHKDITMEII